MHVDVARFTGNSAGATGSHRDLYPTYRALPELAGMLARAETGIGFIYQALDILAAHYHLADLVVSVDGGVAGQQLFRLRRASPRATAHLDRRDGDEWMVDLQATGGSGLLAVPDVVDPVTAAYVMHLAEIALHMDLLSHDASHDPLTGLLNRRSYEATVRQTVSRSRRYGWPFALVLLDVDEFKQVNDSMGHAAGDEALRALAGELRALLRGGDVAARLGGDEFALVVQNAEDAAAVEPLLDRLRDALRDRASGCIRFSAGVAYFPGDAQDAETLSRVADRRLYAAKPR